MPAGLVFFPFCFVVLFGFRKTDYNGVAERRTSDKSSAECLPQSQSLTTSSQPTLQKRAKLGRLASDAATVMDLCTQETEAGNMLFILLSEL